ncbi:hypothetical protein Vadar_027302 [Vaccinium darrowii]|uniref:Uncharacterized protein n=1 Tax=Vaccinium darrowii TaxID=229202 RepID=A0ACB7YZN8_9ERIC|nr:hypothetical protein Vadar_027302 [Vaccinium darrowii]
MTSADLHEVTPSKMTSSVNDLRLGRPPGQVSDATINLVDKMQRHAGLKALDMYKRAGKQAPPSSIQKMEEYVRNSMMFNISQGLASGDNIVTLQSGW